MVNEKLKYKGVWMIIKKKNREKKIEIISNEIREIILSAKWNTLYHCTPTKKLAENILTKIGG